MFYDPSFYRSAHYMGNFTGTHRPAVGLWHYQSAWLASALMTQNDVTAYSQNDGRPDILMMLIPSVPGYMGRVGISGISETAYRWVIYGNPQHIGLYGEPEWSALMDKLTPKSV